MSPIPKTPRVVWIELTSKCPFDCVFCSRKLRRGAGEHLPYPVYQRLIESLINPRKLMLNYSGESVHYPDLVPAIQLARAKGAFVELVSAFSSIQPDVMAALASCGLGRLTISVHAADPRRYAEIYRHSSFADLEARVAGFMDLCTRSAAPPAVDFAFVAMQSNLDQLRPVAEFARRMGVRDIQIFPVLRRDEIPVQFPRELDASGGHREEFVRHLRDAIHGVESVAITISNPAFHAAAWCLGAAPAPFPGELPPGARIHSCEQNPWETAHVLSNGDVVACEVLDRAVMGNLMQQSIEEVWQSEKYESFRRRYISGEQPECRRCVWKRAYWPGPLRSEILARDGASPQLLHGWHDSSAEDVIWSTQQAAAVLKPRTGSHSIHLSALLPPGLAGDPNDLVITCEGREIGSFTNPWEQTVPFGLDFEIPPGAASPWRLEFRTRHMLRPSDRGLGPDARDLGFALVLLTSNRARDPDQERKQALRLEPLRRSVERVDHCGRWLRKHLGARITRMRPRRECPGVSIIIPERDNIGELSACLESAGRAAARSPEPTQVIVVVNGAAPAAYRRLRDQYPACEWRFFPQPLGFSAAICRGLRAARYDWVYLLNSDVALDAAAIEALLPWRAPDVFAIGSQIVLKDPTRYREETNLCALLFPEGIATVHDLIPRSDSVVESFYVGGGASLFRRDLLSRLASASEAYAPFYWEDVEWGWRARKLGYRVLFCPASVAHHRQRATIAKYYEPEAVDNIIERNRLLFQLRNLTGPGPLARFFEEAARLPDSAVDRYLRPIVRWRSLGVRLWNHLAEREDSEIYFFLAREAVDGGTIPLTLRYPTMLP